MKSKKAISPLIATILLVVVAVVLVTIVLSWSKTFTTGSLESGTEIVDNSCTNMIGTLGISSCKILTDGNVSFYLTNRSNDYTYAASDVLTTLITDGLGGIDSNTIDNSLVPGAWSSTFTPGETIAVKLQPVNSAGSNPLTVTVRSTVCPSDAYATAVCRE
jgi:flagellin-like protein